MEHTEHSSLDGFASAARTVGIAAAIFLFVRTFLVEPYFVPSSSMAPTLYAYDHIAVEKFSKYISPPHRGDMLIVEPPAAFFEASGKTEADEPVVLEALLKAASWELATAVFPEGHQWRCGSPEHSKGDSQI